MALSPEYEKDRTLLVGNSAGGVFWSDDDGVSFQPLPPDAATAPLSGMITVAFDPDFARNRTVYAASSAAGAGVYRFIIGASSDWEGIDATLPAGSSLNQLAVSTDGTLYAANALADGGVERSLNPTYPLGPLFEGLSRGLSGGATLSGLWQSGRRLWSADTANNRLMTIVDSLTSPVALVSPAAGAPGVGSVVNHSIANVSLEWESLEGATSYKWQIDYDTDFSSVPSGFGGSTAATSARLPALEPATTYYWRVKATAPVSSPWSARGSFTTSLDTATVSLKPESPPPGASGVPVSPLFQWSAVAGADRYELLVSADADFARPQIVRVGSYALPGNAWQCDVKLDYDTSYYWKVRAINADTASDWSAVGAFTTVPAPAEPPVPAPAPPSNQIASSPSPAAMPSPAIASPRPLPESAPAPPLPPPPAPAPAQNAGMPGWALYLLGALLLVIILLVITILVLATGMRR